jgi:hypothetical protein
MFNLFKKKEKLPLRASGEYNGTYNPIKDSVLSAELLFDHDSVTFLFDKGVKKDVIRRFDWSEVEGFDFNSKKEDKTVVFRTILYLKDGQITLIKPIEESNVQYGIITTLEPHYEKIRQFVAGKLNSESSK